MPTRDPILSIEADRAALADHGLRVTRTRLSVLRALSEHPHAGAEELHLALAQDGVKLSLHSVHTVLADLQRVGVLSQFERDTTSAKVRRRGKATGHHTVCERCGATEDVDLSSVAPPRIEAADSDFSVHVAEVTFWGLCADCQEATAGDRAAAEPS